MAGNKPETGWTPVDFRPDPSGWRAVYLEDATDAGYQVEPVVGWLIAQETLYDPETCEDLPAEQQPTRPRRRVVAGVINFHDVCEISPADEIHTFWYLIRPGNPEPTTAQAVEEMGRRARIERYPPH